MTEGAGARILARVAERDAHAADGIDLDALVRADRGEELLHSRLFGGQLLLVGTVERDAAAAFMHDGAGAAGIDAL